MPEIPGAGSNPIPGGKIPGRGSIPPRPPGLESSAGTVGAGGATPIGADPESVSKLARQAVKYFGFHTEASIMARLAGMGLSPSLGNLRVAQQLLRYGQGLDADMINQLAHQWTQYGGNDVLALEGLVVLHASGLDVDGQNLQAMKQLLAGGPAAHLLARLTMAVKGENNAKLAGLGKKLNQFWQLGHLDKDMPSQLGKFHSQLASIEQELPTIDARGLSEDTQMELGRLADLFGAQKLLSEHQQPNPSHFMPFFVWRDQQPMPGELLVQNDGGGGDNASPFLKVTLAVETKNLGRVVVELTYVRDHLSIRFDVVEDKIKKLIDTRLVLLRQRLVQVPYRVDILACQAVGNARAVSTLLPKRRDLKRLSRAQGVL